MKEHREFTPEILIFLENNYNNLYTTRLWRTSVAPTDITPKFRSNSYLPPPHPNSGQKEKYISIKKKPGRWALYQLTGSILPKLARYHKLGFRYTLYGFHGSKIWRIVVRSRGEITGTELLLLILGLVSDTNTNRIKTLNDGCLARYYMKCRFIPNSQKKKIHEIKKHIYHCNIKINQQYNT
jgi:hypothetical protein